MRVNMKGDIGEQRTCAVGILFIFLATGTTGPSTTTSTSTTTTTPLTATSKCIGTPINIQYILGVQLCLLFSDKIVATFFTLCSVEVYSFTEISHCAL